MIFYFFVFQSSRNSIKMNVIMPSGATIRPCTLNDFCRLCANFEDNMISIYSDEGVDHMLENKIKTHLPFINVLYTFVFSIKLL